MLVSVLIHQGSWRLSQPLNTPLRPPGSRLLASRRSTAIVAIKLRIFLECFNVVSCQLQRLRLLETAQTANGVETNRGRNTTEVRAVHSEKAYDPQDCKPMGSVTVVSPLHPKNALSPMVVREFGSVREVSPLHRLNA